MNKLKKLMIAAPNSNTGKTLVTTSLVRFFKDQGYALAAAKTGPDYLDTKFLSAVLGEKAMNFDLFLMGEDLIRHKIARTALTKELLMVEGVMGYFDGMGNSYLSSSYDLADKMNIATILLYEPKGEAFSVIPKLMGMESFAKGRIKGLIFNKTSKKMYENLKEQVENYTSIQVLGYIPFDEELSIEERNLGLLRPFEIQGFCSKIDKMVSYIKEFVDTDALLELASEDSYEEDTFRTYLSGKTIALAKDDAFSFHYDSEVYRQGNFFSPLKDKRLPEADLLIFGGGYPELYVQNLSENKEMIRQIRNYHEHGGKIFAYGGGLMYLSESLDGFETVGLFEGHSHMEKRLQHFGYQKATIKKEFLGQEQGELIGREFHRGVFDTRLEPRLVLKKPLGEKRTHYDGYKSKNAYGCFMHMHPERIAGRLKEFMEETCI